MVLPSKELDTTLAIGPSLGKGGKVYQGRLPAASGPLLEWMRHTAARTAKLETLLYRLRCRNRQNLGVFLFG